MQLRPVSVSVRLMLAVAAVVAVVVALAGLVIVLRVDRGERAAVDRALALRASEVSKVAVRSGALPTDGTFAVRVVAGARVSAQKGATTQFSIPVANGYSTVTAADGSQWRSLAQPLKSGAQLQILINLADVEDRHAGNIRTINVAVLLAALIAAAGVRLTAELAQRRQTRETAGTTPAAALPNTAAAPNAPESNIAAEPTALADPNSAASPDISDSSAIAPPTAVTPPGTTAAGAVTSDATSSASPASPGPALSAGPVSPGAGLSAGAASRNGVASPHDSALAGVPGSPDVAASQGSASEAGEAELVRLFRDPVAALGTGLETLLDNPDMSPTQRHLVLAAVQTEHRRLIELLEALEAPERHA